MAGKTKIVIHDPEQYTFEEIPCGTVFTVKDWSNIYIKTECLQKRVAKSDLNVNAINMDDGMGTCISHDTGVNIFTELSCKRQI